MVGTATEFPHHHRLTVEDYYRMGEIGILRPDERLELIEGEIIDMAPPGELHAGTAIEVADTSLRYERDVKVPLYARHGIAEFGSSTFGASDSRATARRRKVRTGP